MKKLQKLAANMLPDLAGLAGAGLVTLGAWQIWPPAGLIVGGVLLVTLVVLFERGSNND